MILQFVVLCARSDVTPLAGQSNALGEMLLEEKSCNSSLSKTTQAPFEQSSYQAVLQADVVVGLLGNPDGFLKCKFSLLAMSRQRENN